MTRNKAHRDASVPYRANSDVFTTMRHKRRMDTLPAKRGVIVKGQMNGRTLEHVSLSSADKASKLRKPGHVERYHATKGWRFERERA